MAELDKEVFRLESHKAGYEDASEKQINYMWDEYELTYNRALELRDRNLTDISKMKKRIQEIKAEIKALGSVNVNAIEDFKNVSDRYEFLKTQHDDLVTAEATLEMAQKSYDISQKMYEVGKATLVELNDAQLALTQAQLNMNQAIFQYMTNKAAIDELMGVEYVSETK